MKNKEAFEGMLGDWYKYKDYITLSLKFMEQNDTEVVKRILACLVSINRIKTLKDNGIGYKRGWIGFKKEFFTKTDPHMLKRECDLFMDHAASLYFKKEKRRILISEPYGLQLDELKALIKFCEENNYYCEIGGVFHQSIHFPNNTIQIGFYKIQDEKQKQEEKEREAKILVQE